MENVVILLGYLFLLIHCVFVIKNMKKIGKDVVLTCVFDRIFIGLVSLGYVLLILIPNITAILLFFILIIFYICYLIYTLYNQGNYIYKNIFLYITFVFAITVYIISLFIDKPEFTISRISENSLNLVLYKFLKFVFYPVFNSLFLYDVVEKFISERHLSKKKTFFIFFIISFVISIFWHINNIKQEWLVFLIKIIISFSSYICIFLFRKKNIIYVIIVIQVFFAAFRYFI